MSIFKIPVVWQMAGTMEIEADTLEQAEEIALGPAPLFQINRNHENEKWDCEAFLKDDYE